MQGYIRDDRVFLDKCSSCQNEIHIADLPGRGDSCHQMWEPRSVEDVVFAYLGGRNVVCKTLWKMCPLTLVKYWIVGNVHENKWKMWC